MSDAKQQSLTEELAALKASLATKIPPQAASAIQAVVDELRERKVGANAKKVLSTLIQTNIR
jgi:hypothetical protein